MAKAEADQAAGIKQPVKSKAPGAWETYQSSVADVNNPECRVFAFSLKEKLNETHFSNRGICLMFRGDQRHIRIFVQLGAQGALSQPVGLHQSRQDPRGPRLPGRQRGFPTLVRHDLIKLLTHPYHQYCHYPHSYPEPEP